MLSCRSPREVVYCGAAILLACGHAAVGAAESCGTPGTIRGKAGDHFVDLKTRVFADGSIAVRAPLAVNPDGGPGSYTMGDHGFTYIANGLARCGRLRHVDRSAHE